MRYTLGAVSLVLLLACLCPVPHDDTDDTDVDSADTDTPDSPVDTGPFDADGDGHADAVDCDDANPEVYPGHPEVCGNTLDDDCSGTADDGPIPTWYTDGDHDGFGDPDTAVQACTAPQDTIARGDDCADDDETIHPGAPEDCGDAVDSDCDGRTGGGTGTPDLFDLTVGASASITFTPQYATLDVLGDVDVDGDGADDLVVGVSHDGMGATNGGAVYVFRGPVATGASTSADAWASRLGSVENGVAGKRVISLGDLDADGTDDLAVGAPGTALASGRVYLLRGPMTAGQALLDTATAVLSGPISTGTSLVAAGDQNGDDCPDLLGGVPRFDAGSGPVGAVFLLSGCATGQVALASLADRRVGTEPNGNLGNAVSAGDHDDDGDIDLWAAAYYADAGSVLRAGRVYGWDDGFTGVDTVADADLVITGDTAHRFFGQSLDGSADLDLDGKADLLVGEPGTDDTQANSYGWVSVFRGPATGTGPDDADVALEGVSRYDYLGSDVAHVGDPTGDGVGDVVIGAWGYDDSVNRHGAGYLFHGPLSCVDGVEDADWLFHAGTGASFVRAARAGDLDGDGQEDLLLWSSTVGTVWMVSGADI